MFVLNIRVDFIISYLVLLTFINQNDSFNNYHNALPFRMAIKFDISAFSYFTIFKL